MVKVFVSQPMNGLTEDEILRERNEAIRCIKSDLESMGQDMQVIESYFEDYNPQEGCVPLKYLSKSLELMADADLVVFLKGWENARGCKLEYECAKAYGLNVEKFKQKKITP